VQQRPTRFALAPQRHTAWPRDVARI